MNNSPLGEEMEEFRGPQVDGWIVWVIFWESINHHGLSTSWTKQVNCVIKIHKVKFWFNSLLSPARCCCLTNRRTRRSFLCFSETTIVSSVYHSQHKQTINPILYYQHDVRMHPSHAFHINWGIFLWSPGEYLRHILQTAQRMGWGRITCRKYSLKQYNVHFMYIIDHKIP